MVKRQRHHIKLVDKEKSNVLTMQTRPYIFFENPTHRPTRRDLIFARPAIFCFSADSHCKSVASPNRTKPTLRLSTHLHFYQHSNYLQL